MIKKVLLLVLLFLSLLFDKPSYAHKPVRGLHFGIKLPYTYNLGYYKRFNPRIGMHVDLQFVTFPFNRVPLFYMEIN